MLIDSPETNCRINGGEMNFFIKCNNEIFMEINNKEIFGEINNNDF